MKKNIVLVFIIVITTITSAQTKVDTTAILSLNKIAQVNQGNSQGLMPFNNQQSNQNSNQGGNAALTKAAIQSMLAGQGPAM